MISMDLMAGTIVLTSVFLAVVGLAALGPGGSADDASSKAEGQRRRKVVLTVLLVVYFLGITNVLIITQQRNLAYLNIAVGLVLATFLYRSGTAPSPKGEVNPAERPEEVANPSPLNR
jgi:hypothetical protein